MNILLIRMDLLGDGIVSGTFIDSLKTSIPSSRIDVLCNTSNVSAFTFHPNINNVYKLNHQQKTKQLASDLDDVISRINGTVSYDLVIVLNGCARSYRYAMRINAKKIIARNLFTKSIRSKCLMLTMKYLKNVSFFVEPFGVHEVVRLNKYCQFVLDYLKISANAYLPPRANFYPDINFSLSSIIPKSVVINVSGKKDESRYVNDNLLYALVNELTKLNYFISVVFLNEDSERINTIQDNLNIPLNLINDSNIFNVAKHIATHEYYIGVDGGLAHVAAGVGVKCIILFDNQDINLWHPWTELQTSIQSVANKIYDISYLDVLNFLGVK